MFPPSIKFVEEFFTDRGVNDQGAEFYLDFLDGLSTRMIQFVLDGASLWNDAAMVMGLLSDLERDFIQYMKDALGKDDDGAALTGVILLSFSQQEKELQHRALPGTGPFSVEEVEDLIRMIFSPGGGS